MTKPFDRLLRETLAARGAVPTTPCLDAQTAAALADDTLTARERAGAEAHVAECARCQALLAAMARTAPVPARRWWQQPVMMWAASLTVAAAAAIVWINVSRHEPAEPAAVQTTRADTAASAIGATQPDQRAIAKEAPPRSAASTGLERTTPPSLAKDRDKTAAAKTPQPIQPNALVDATTATPAESKSAAADTRSEDVQLPSTPLPLAAPAPSAEPDLAERSRRATAAQPPQSQRAETSIATRESAQLMARSFNAVRDPVVMSSNPRNRWRIGRDGAIDHTSDGGVTWQPQTTGVGVTLTAGASPSPSVCWLVGPAGVVALTTDEGRSWQRVAFPEAVDLSGVRAADEKAATILAADGRTFATQDGGRTWR
jgi:Photosynthesis system II assembly factor YCF48